MNPFALSDDISINLQKLIETRMLLQANSGGGKSWAIRRILEQTHGQVQQIVLDVEDEFYTLREQYDYVLVRREEGDCVPEVRSAGLLARRLLELGVSAIISIYEMKHHERISFVKAFLDAMVNAPKTLWHPVLVVVDEAHIFCPESSKAESASSVIDLMTRGRKRGFCGILATQRISKLNKDAGAEANNKLIGRAAIDVDMKRAGDELGFTKKDDQLSLRTLKPGQFYVFGPAVSDIVIPITVGLVKTTHPKAGAAQVPIAPPKQKVVALLSKLGDLPKEAHEELVTIDQLRRELTNTRAELTRVKNAQPKVPEPKVEVREVPVLVAEEEIHRLEKFHSGIKNAVIEANGLAERLQDALNFVRNARAKVGGGVPTAVSAVRQSKPLEALSGRKPSLTQREDSARPAPSSNGDSVPLGKAARKILGALVQYPQGRTKRQVALLSGYAINGGGFNNALGQLRSLGLAEGSNPIKATSAGAVVAPSDPLPTGEELFQHWRAQLGKCEREILDVLYAAYPKTMSKEDVAAATDTGYEPGGGGFNNSLGRLRTLELIEGSKDALKASDDFFQ
jgi:hypothetical protein